MRRSLWYVGAFALVAGCATMMSTTGTSPLAASSPECGPPTVTLTQVPLTITTARGMREFTVELARTEAEQAQGLMFRTDVPKGTGMLFPMSPPREASFWMKNTLIPLDMIFIRPDGTIARIAARTVPESLALVDSGEPVVAVLELAGGAAAAQGIEAGDRVRWPGGPTG